MLFLFAYRRFIGASAGSLIKQVQCEKCQGRFAYEIVRLGLGSDASLYMLQDSTAAENAQQSAQRDLDRRMERETDPVPCPHCGWMQQDMVRDIRRGKMAWIRTLVYWSWAVLAMVLFLAVCIGYAVNSTGDFWTTGFLSVLKLALWPVGVGVGLLVCRWLLALQCAPNAQYPTPAVAPACAPVALLPGRDGAWAPAAPRKVLLGNGRVAMRLHGRPFPPTCCCCLAPQETVFVPPKMPFANTPLLDVPICHSCARRSDRIVHRWMLAVPVISLAIAYGIALAFVTGGTLGQVTATVPIALALAIPGLLIVPYRMAAPYRIYRFDVRRLTCQMWFRNPAYAQAIAAYARQRSSPGVLQHPSWNDVAVQTHVHPSSI